MAKKDPMEAKTNELAGGDHTTSVTFGIVVSDYETDAAGNGPEDLARWAEEAKEADRKAAPVATKKSSKK